MTKEMAEYAEAVLLEVKTSYKRFLRALSHLNKIKGVQTTYSKTYGRRDYYGRDKRGNNTNQAQPVDPAAVKKAEQIVDIEHGHYCKSIYERTFMLLTPEIGLTGPEHRILSEFYLTLKDRTIQECAVAAGIPDGVACHRRGFTKLAIWLWQEKQKGHTWETPCYDEENRSWS